MIFYAMPGSSYSAKVRIVLVAKNVDFEEREPPGGYRSETYRRIVPMGTVPAIVDDALVLSESEAINEYLEERFVLPALLPADPQQRARARFLSRFHDLYLEPPLRALFGQVAPTGRDAALIAARIADIRNRVAQLEGLCSPSPFLAGPALSLADCGPAISLPLAQMLLGAIGETLPLPPAITAWQRAVQAHPAVAQVLGPWRAATETWLNARLAA